MMKIIDHERMPTCLLMGFTQMRMAGREVVMRMRHDVRIMSGPKDQRGGGSRQCYDCHGDECGA